MLHTFVGKWQECARRSGAGPRLTLWDRTGIGFGTSCGRISGTPTRGVFGIREEVAVRRSNDREGLPRGVDSFAELAFRAKSATVRRRNGAFFRELMAQQSLPPEALRDLQWERATALLRFASGATDFYPDFYARHGVDVSAVREWDDWESLPIIDRTTVKEHSADFLSVEAGPGTVREALTGGSTGQPLQTKQDARVPSLALAWRMYSWWGIQPWDNLARVGRWGFGRADALKNGLQWWPTRQSYLDAALLSPDSMRAFHRQLVTTRPALLEGYVGSMLEFADFLEASGWRCPRSPRSRPPQRRSRRRSAGGWRPSSTPPCTTSSAARSSAGSPVSAATTTGCTSSRTSASSRWSTRTGSASPRASSATSW